MLQEQQGRARQTHRLTGIITFSLNWSRGCLSVKSRHRWLLSSDTIYQKLWKLLQIRLDFNSEQKGKFWDNSLHQGIFDIVELQMAKVFWNLKVNAQCTKWEYLGMRILFLPPGFLIINVTWFLSFSLWVSCFDTMFTSSDTWLSISKLIVA